MFNSYRKELTLESFKNGKPVKKSDRGNDVKKVQEWLCLNSVIYKNLNSTEIDSNFGNATEICVKDFQKLKNINVSGVVDESTFFELSKPLRNAFTAKNIPNNNFRELICKIAQLHFENSPRELTKHSIGNLGPWVRSYCMGEDGDDYWWCMGFVQNIFDLSCDLFGNNFKDYMSSKSLDCDVVAQFAISKDRLIRNADLKNRINEINPGDLFFKYSPDKGNEWHHVGIITKVFPDGVIETIEGNASKDKEGNIGDTSNGNGVFSKYRNLFDKKQLKTDAGSLYWDYYEVYKIQ